MFWSDDDNSKNIVESDEIIDVSIHFFCHKLPGDHIFLLVQALTELSPWLKQDPQISIQQIYIPASGNGWQRDDLSEKLVYLSKRTRLKIRLPIKYLERIKLLSGKDIYVAGNKVTFGNIKLAKIKASEILVARFVHISDTDDDEEKFLSLAYEQLKQHNIVLKKMLCGKSVFFNFAGNNIKTRSLMLADLSVEDSLTLQSVGVGEHYLLGCGVFIPQKGIKAINQEK